MSVFARSAAALTALGLLLAAGGATAQRVSDVRNTKHNLSVTGPGPVRAVSQDRVCVFCHTPHGATTAPAAPLWNRALAGDIYTGYTSSSIDAPDLGNTVGGASKLCLSCHDGTVAVGAVNVAGGQTNPTFDMTGTAAGGTIPPGEGPLTGYTRNLGVDLTNDHPISFTYDTTLALTDGELRDPDAVPHIGVRVPGVQPKPRIPLHPGPTLATEGTLECTSCHDPH
ncbi:MAG: hypothetical protein PVF91_09865, partial [Chromatiales bacterium]